MKPRPTTIQPGATHWNPNAGPDWYTKDFGTWLVFKGQHTWVVAPNEISEVDFSALVPVEHLMAQHNGANSLIPEVTQAVSENYTARLKREIEWNGEGLPPVGTLCRLRIGEWVHAQAKITYMGNGVFCYEVSGTEYTGAVRDANFYPIKSEREKAIKAIEVIIFKPDCSITNAAERLYNEGYRKVEVLDGHR